MTVKEIQYTAQGGQHIVSIVEDGIVFVACRNMICAFERGKLIHTFKAHHIPESSLALAVLSEKKHLLSSTQEETKIWDVSNPRQPTFITTTVLAGGQWACTRSEKIHTSPTRDFVTVIGDLHANLIQKVGTVKLYTSPTTLFLLDQRGVVSFYQYPCQKTTRCYRIVPSITAPISQIAATDSTLAVCIGTRVKVFGISLPEHPMIHEFEIKPNQRIKAFGDIFATYNSSKIVFFDNYFKTKGVTLSVKVGEIVDLALAPQRLFVLGTERTAIITFKT